MKKGIAILLAGIMSIVLALPVSAFDTDSADTPEIATHSQIGPQWLSTSYVSHGVTISSSGKSVTTVQFNTYRPTDYIELEVTLQKLEGYSYEDYQDWSSTGYGRCTISKTLYVPKGTYRVKTVGTVYDQYGNYLETVPLYSTSKTYS